MSRFRIDFHRLPVQMLIGVVGLVLLTALAAGLPAFWLLRNQLEDQAWAQVIQGGRAAQALYVAQQNEMANLATLTAQRPTLQQLLDLGQAEPFRAYLEVLRAGAGLDLVLVCDGGGQMVAGVGEIASQNFCGSDLAEGFQALPVEGRPQVWLLATHSLEGPAAGKVVVGQHLDDAFVEQMHVQAGLEHTLLVGRRPVATSLDRRDEAELSFSGLTSGEFQQDRLTLAGQPYYLLRFPLVPAEPAVEAEVALDVANIEATQQRLVWTLAGTLLLVILLGSSLGIILARQITWPLGRLAKAATNFSQGDLTRPVLVSSWSREVTLVASTLEAARIDLNLTLSDLQREKLWTDHLLAAIVEGIVTLDRNSRIIFFSRGAERITGWSQDEALGRTCDEIFPLVERHERFSQLLAVPGFRNKITVAMRDGRRAVLSMTSAQLLPPEGSEARLVLVIRDVSETEVIHHLMGHFMANIAHEFRTPLSALAASVELLLDQAPDLNAAELKELVGSLYLGIVGLQTLVDNLLEGASIEAGRFRVYARPVSLEAIITEGVRLMSPLLEKYGQRLVLELPAVLPVVRADLRRTVQVLVNLLSNANKYGADQGEIVLRVVNETGQVRISVVDQGPGIPVAYRHNLFRQFGAPELNSDKAQVGMGLGLSVVKAIVEAQGGQVGVEDRPGGGSIFWFTLIEEQIDENTRR